MKSETIMRFGVRFYIGVFFLTFLHRFIIHGTANSNDSRFSYRITLERGLRLNGLQP